MKVSDLSSFVDHEILVACFEDDSPLLSPDSFLLVGENSQIGSYYVDKDLIHYWLLPEYIGIDWFID